MTRPEFVHLHVHSEYSLLDGANRISNLVNACVDDGQTALALTDHGNMFGAIELYQKARAKDVKPILGCEVYIARESMHQKHHRERNPYSHLTLLARTNEGLHNLIKMASLSYTEGHSMRPRIDMDLLAENAAGISCLSGCLSGEMNQMIRRDRQAEAEALAIRMRDMFGPDHFWLELQRNGIEIQDRCNEALVEIHKRTDIPIVATNDIHYLRHEDCAVQDVLLCINTGAKRDDEKRFKMDTSTLYFQTREQMAAMFKDMPSAVTATLDVASQVDVEIEFGKYHVPVFTSDTGESPDALFDRLLEEGLAEKYGMDNTVARERLEYEKRIISELGFVSYFLIVWDLIKWARDHDIPVGPGRGSAAGSIVAYLMDITKVCPLHYDLLFERFLNAARVSMPDIDIDFCKEGRDAVIQYTREKYGNEYVAQIVTFGTMASRTVVRDVARVLDVPLRDVDRVAKKIPAGPGAPTLAKALESDEDLLTVQREMPELKELFDLSVELEGQVRHISTHAAGIVIADKPITEYVPLCLQNGTDISTQWPAGQLEELGLLKMDYLGLRTLTILDRTIDNIKKRGGTPPDLDDLPAGDPATYAMLMRGDTLGVFQLESEGMRKLLARLKPDRFEDLIAVLALYRPGPLESGMDEMFIRRKHGEEEVTYPHECIESILSDTYGCIVYQEQVMLISNELGGFSLNEADNLRKAMGKKKPEIMQAFSAQFIDGAEKKGCARDVAQEVWDNIVKFGGYGFNKSHSTAYALITYQTAYLKANFRTAYLAGNMSCEMQDSDKIKAFIDDCKRSDIEVRLPDSRFSTWEFEPEDGGIRFGLGAIKGTGQKAVESMVAVRNELEKPADLHNWTSEVDPGEVNKSTWEALIKAGCFDWTNHNRGAVMSALDHAMADGAQAAANRKSGQMSMFDAMGGGGGEAPEPETSPIDDSKAWDEKETLSAEREVLGLYLSGHPLEENSGVLSLLANTNTKRLHELASGAEVTMAGMVTGYAQNIVKNGRMAGQKMARFFLEDLDGSIQVTVFPRTFEEVREVLAEDAIIVLKGKLEDRGDGFALILNELRDVEAALEQFTGALVVQLDARDRTKLPELKQLMSTSEGPNPLYFDVEGSDGDTRRVRAGQNGVKVNAPLVRSLDSLLEPGRTSLARM